MQRFLAKVMFGGLVGSAFGALGLAILSQLVTDDRTRFSPLLDGDLIILRGAALGLVLGLYAGQVWGFFTAPSPRGAIPLTVTPPQAVPALKPANSEFLPLFCLLDRTDLSLIQLCTLEDITDEYESCAGRLDLPADTTIANCWTRLENAVFRRLTNLKELQYDLTVGNGKLADLIDDFIEECAGCTNCQSYLSDYMATGHHRFWLSVGVARKLRDLKSLRRRLKKVQSSLGIRLDFTGSRQGRVLMKSWQALRTADLEMLKDPLSAVAPGKDQILCTLLANLLQKAGITLQVDQWQGMGSACKRTFTFTLGTRSLHLVFDGSPITGQFAVTNSNNRHDLEAFGPAVTAVAQALALKLVDHYRSYEPDSTNAAG